MFLDSDTDKRTIFQKDHYGQLPIEAPCECGPLELIQCLLRTSVCDQIERVWALERWKIDLEELITSMQAMEDSERQVQQIYERLSKYEKMERISLLELAIWRTSCMNAGSTKFDSMQAMEDYLLATDEASNSA